MSETIRAAFVIARRDFTALIRSRAFIFFLIGPIVMLGIALAAGGIGSRMETPPATLSLAVAMPDSDATKLAKAHQTLQRIIPAFPSLRIAPAKVPLTSLLNGGGSSSGVLSGSLNNPVLYASEADASALADDVRLLVDQARQVDDHSIPQLVVRTVTVGRGVVETGANADRSTTAQLGQITLFLATMLLAGMVLSNMVEEKANKIIEILAASVPMEAIFLGKLFAMLAMALIAIAAWVTLGSLLALAAGSAMPSIPAPAVGWPVFVALGLVYFSTAYLLLGSLYLSIGALAATVRDVQTLSMPVSMGQVGIFLFANYAAARQDSVAEIVACIFPFSSPFALMARAARFEDLWPHLVLLLWQGLCLWLTIRVGTRLFRHNVMKSRSTAGRRSFLRSSR